MKEHSSHQNPAKEDKESNKMEPESSMKGQWEPIKYKFNHIPVHIALLHTNKVLAFDGTGNDEKNKKPYPAEVFDPETDKYKSYNKTLMEIFFVRDMLSYQTENYS